MAVITVSGAWSGLIPSIVALAGSAVANKGTAQKIYEWFIQALQDSIDNEAGNTVNLD